MSLRTDFSKQFAALLRSVDIFKQPVPTLNLNGKTKIPTIYGSCISILLLLVLFVYADFKLRILISRQNPQVTSSVEESVLTSQDKVNLKRSGLRFAWTIEGYVD